MHRPRPLWQSAVFFVLLVGCFGVGLGVPVLFRGIVPLEAWLQQQHLSQAEVSSVLSLLIMLFGLLVVSGAVLAHYLVRGKERRPWLGAVLLIVGGLLAFYGSEQLFTAGTLVRSNSSQFELQDQRFNFGPYPDLEMMRQLNREGINHIITLLSTDLPFEAQLLAKERANAERFAVTVHSYPMLPWVFGNEQSLTAAAELVNSLPGERFYVHCYLGKHRVALLRNYLEERVSDEWTEQPWPEQFERGSITSLDDGRIAVGPQPTAEEWLELGTRRVEVVVSLLDPSVPEQANRIAEAKANAEQLHMQFRLQPVTGQQTEQQVAALMDFVKSHPESKLYIFDFASGETTRRVVEAIGEVLEGLR